MRFKKFLCEIAESFPESGDELDRIRLACVQSIGWLWGTRE
jgi:hypothetical protein